MAVDEAKGDRASLGARAFNQAAGRPRTKFHVFDAQPSFCERDGLWFRRAIRRPRASEGQVMQGL